MAMLLSPAAERATRSKASYDGLPPDAQGRVRKAAVAALDKGVLDEYDVANMLKVPVRTVKDWRIEERAPRPVWRLDVPAAPKTPRDLQRADSYRRGLWVVQQRDRGRKIGEIALELGISYERVRQIEARTRREVPQRARQEMLRLGGRDDRIASGYLSATNLGRPVDMGGPRDVWLVYELDRTFADWEE
jgi:hypothetical protein